ncbi:putative RNA methyltransferase [Vreelandella neptunia]|uniref:Methyltransferase domain-containing protein n=1 Tax=Vreelandella neptunia TaxID=115551 RepID=A0ABS9S6H4_9GAMM|nr:methyltransferase domain-containing protein [Halomonas neptunia]MCH4811716.1 methyltransferase domain-containing protein [Halomonas neptunia]
MSITPFQALACPLDGEPLIRSGSTWSCLDGHGSSKHSFDIAKQGYVNLLPVQQKRSHDPGDSKAMVAARQRFLEAGHYQPIADAVSHVVLSHAEGQATGSPLFSCLDAGCGEGYYLRQLVHAASSSLSLIGLDISKWAVQAAAKQEAKQSPLSSWVVGSNAHLPVQSETLDCVLCMFGFPVVSEFARVLKTGGVWLQVEAGPDHLRELREIIYPTLKPERSSEVETPAAFTHHSGERVSYSLALNGKEEIADLLAMTPHLYRASAEGRARAAALVSLEVTVDVRVEQWLRT